MKEFKNRKEQIEKEFGRELRRVLMEEGIGYFNRRQLAAIRSALRNSAMVGAAEERHRTLQIVQDSAYRSRIIEKPVLVVLGYE